MLDGSQNGSSLHGTLHQDINVHDLAIKETLDQLADAERIRELLDVRQ